MKSSIEFAMSIHSKKLTHACCVCFMALLAGCGGGGGGGENAGAGAVVATVAPFTGVFLDSAVQGLHYRTPTQQGDTNANGEFTYLQGETVTFSVGYIKLPAALARPVMTPLDLAVTTNPADQRLVNMLVLLQSLDADGNPANGIAIPPGASALAPSGINLDVSPAMFRAGAALNAFIASAVLSTRTLVLEVDAKSHFQSALNNGMGAGKINIAPFASAGASQSVATGSTVVLDGSASADANADALTYQWTLTGTPSASAATLHKSTSSAANFVADVPGIYMASLVVRDGVASSAVATVTVSASGGGVVNSAAVPAGYNLVWSDEFSSSVVQLPDSSKWAYDTSRNALGWFNNELQYYANGRTQNSSVQGGKLIITARKENLSSLVSDWGGQSYTSARLVTKGKASWTYGFFEVRAKLPCGAGTWPAIWTLGSTVNTWPDQGEIDIMEQTGWDKQTVLGTVHTPAGFGGGASSGSKTLLDACTAFHNYQIKWTPSAIEFYVDGVSYRPAYTNPTPGVANNAWPFNNPQYLLLNLAVGGDLGGTVNDATLSSTSLEVDYVRVYQAP